MKKKKKTKNVQNEEEQLDDHPLLPALGEVPPQAAAITWRATFALLQQESAPGHSASDYTKFAQRMRSRGALRIVRCSPHQRSWRPQARPPNGKR
jgi:hypothetical protein